MTADLEKKPFSLRPSADVHERLNEAASWRGLSLTSFVLGAAMREADDVLESKNQIKLTNDDAEVIASLLDSPREPNDRMKDAIRIHNELLGA